MDHSSSSRLHGLRNQVVDEMEMEMEMDQHQSCSDGVENENENENEKDLQRLRSDSHTSLRPAIPFSLSSSSSISLSISSHVHFHQLINLILSPVYVDHTLKLYLSLYPSLQNILHSILLLLARNPLPPSLHTSLLHAAVYPYHSHLQHPCNNNNKDINALRFIHATSTSPPKVPFQLRQAISPDRVERIALVAATGVFYSTMTSLLGISYHHKNKKEQQRQQQQNHDHDQKTKIKCSQLETYDR